jgi:hypothetical protein
MRQVALACAATAALSFSVPAAAQVTNYSLKGSVGSGTLSLDYDSGSSTWALTGMNFIVGPTFDTTNAALQNNSAGVLEIGGDVNGVGMSSNTDDFSFLLDTSLASQTVQLAYSEVGGGIYYSTVTIDSLGSHGTTTDYALTSPSGSGTLSLNYDSGSSTWSLIGMDFIVGPTFDTSNAAVQNDSAGVLEIGGDVNGVGMSSNTDDFSFLLDTSLASQSVQFVYSHVGGGINYSTLSINSLPAAVPEPGTWMIMLLGLGAIGIAARRNSAKVRLAGE